MTDLPPPPSGGPEPAERIVYVEAPKKRGGFMKIALIILGLFALLFVGCIAVIATGAESVNESLEVAEDERADDEALVEDNAIITDCTVGDFGTASATVEFTNPLEEEKGFISIEVNFLDGSTVVGSGTVIFENLSPGQKAIGEATAFDLADGTDQVTCKVVDGTVL